MTTNHFSSKVAARTEAPSPRALASVLRHPTPRQARRRTAYMSQMHVPEKIAVLLAPSELLVAARIGERAQATGICADAVKDLAEACDVSQSMVTRTIRLLQDDGFVTTARRGSHTRVIEIVDADWLEWLKDPEGNRARIDRGLPAPGMASFI